MRLMNSELCKYFEDRRAYYASKDCEEGTLPTL